jgi:SNF2 family DNA or RNA helicase
VPHEYQERGIKLLLSKSYCGLFLKPGLGKTSITLAAISALLKKGLVRRVLIVGPLRVIGIVWPAEIELWDDFRHLTYSVLHGKEKDARINDKTDIHLTNYENLASLLTTLKDTKRWPYDMVVFDESSKMKAHGSQRFKAVSKYLGKFSRRVILTGTPAPNGLMDLFSQMYCVDLGRSLGSFITHFRNKYFTKDPFQPYVYLLKPGSKEQIYKAIESRVMHMSSEDYFKLPLLTETNIYVDLPPDARAQYKTMEALLFTKIESKVVTAANAAVASGKCRQLANGFMYDDGTTSLVHSAKLDAFTDLLEELDGKPVIVFYEYEADYHRMNEKHPGEHIGGALTPAQQALIGRWNEGAVPILYAHPASAGHGLNLQFGGCNIIWFSPTWNCEYFEQAIARLYRQGQKDPVFVYYILARGTIDLAIMQRLAAKDKLQCDLLTALKVYWKEQTI